jgi:hypothetical protein
MSSGSCTLGTTVRWLQPNTLDTTYSTNTQTTGVRHLVSKMTPPPLTREDRGHLSQGDPSGQWTSWEPNNVPGCSTTSCGTRLTGHEGKTHALPLEGSRSLESKAFHVQAEEPFCFTMRKRYATLGDSNLLHQGGSRRLRNQHALG